MSVRLLSALAEGIGQLLSPRACRICGCSLTVGEEVICLGCLLGMPRTGIHRQTFNEIHQRLGHHSMVDRAAAWFDYDKESVYAQLLIDAKYGGMHSIDRSLGRLYARELEREGFFGGIDCLVPMPMYWLKRWRRGYNQAREISLGISEVTGVEVVQAIRAVKPHGTQARHDKAQRHRSITGTMAIDPGADICGRHVLLVDDIITSGSSCIEALRALAEGSPSAVSVLALGLTKRR